VNTDPDQTDGAGTAFMWNLARDGSSPVTNAPFLISLELSPGDRWLVITFEVKGFNFFMVDTIPISIETRHAQTAGVVESERKDFRAASLATHAPRCGCGKQWS